MAKQSSSGAAGKSGNGNKPSRGVSSARLHQSSGSGSAFGGHEKIRRDDGSFRMRKSGK